jgi:quercetin dioxygenase-like cupin family protein
MRMTLCVLGASLLAAGCNPLSRLGMLPTLPEARAAADAICEPGSCSAIPRIVEPNAPASVWSVRFAGGAMRLPADAMAEWFGLVLSGDLEVEGCGKLGRYHAYRVDGGGVKLSGHADVVLGFAVDGPLGGRGAGAVAAPKSVGRCETVDLAALPDVQGAEDSSHARLAFRGRRASFGLVYTDAGTGVPSHANLAEWEIIHVLRGTGEVRTGDEVGPLMTGISYAFAPGERHSVVPLGDAPTVMVQMHSPPGPEPRGVKAAEGR